MSGMRDELSSALAALQVEPLEAEVREATSLDAVGSHAMIEIGASASDGGSGCCSCCIYCACFLPCFCGVTDTADSAAQVDGDATWTTH